MDEMSLRYLTITRRKLHALAELSGAEYNTSAFIAAELKRFGCKPKSVGTGLYCDIGKNPELAFRADIDALPIIEDVDITGMKECAANGVMHACGHDGHTAVLLNVARILGGKSDVSVRLIFQHDEEVSGGSTAMIDAGVLNGIEEIYALHLCPELEQGKIGYCYGSMFAGCCEFDVEFSGKAGHCAMPDECANAVRSAISVADDAYRLADSNGILLNLGKINGGYARNIISDSCVEEFSLRFYDTAKCESFMLGLERAALRSDDCNGTTHTINTVAVYPPLTNNALCVDKVRKIMGNKCVSVPPRNTAEDFANYLQKIPGCMVWLGIRSNGHTSPLHSTTFSFDESALQLGTEMFLNIIQSYR